MSHIRTISFTLLCLSSFIYLFFISPDKGFALYIFDDLMTRREKEITGIDDLDHNQIQALENWINRNFILKADVSKAPPPKQLSLSENFDNGKSIRLNDGSVYEVNPDDIQYSALWITPFPIQITTSGNADYPLKITNTLTGTSIAAKQTEPPRM